MGTCGINPCQTRPFGYIGRQALNWAAEIHNVGDTLEISQADATANYGSAWGYADLDTAKGAWNDKGPNGATNGKGWAHNTEYGLFQSEVDTLVTLTPTALSAASGGWNNFGITVFTGMDSPDSAYSHHDGWNSAWRAGINEVPATKNNPHSTDNLIYLTHISTGSLSFLATAGQIYSIYLGGNAGDGVFGPHDGYKLAITTAAPVPLPAAVWLFVSALAGMGVFSRRKHRAG